MAKTMTAHKPRIVYVEDEADLAEAVGAYLGAKGFSFLSIADGSKALEALRQDPPDLVLLDVMLPGTDGWQLLRQMKEDPALGKVPVVFVSARTQVADRVAGLQMGARDYLTKPFSLAELAERIRTQLTLQAQGGVEEGWKLSSSGLTFDPKTGSLNLGSSSLMLSRTEAQVLRTLMLFPGRIFSLDRLARLLWELECYLTAPEVGRIIGELAEKLKRIEGGQGRLKEIGQGGWSWD